jgi:hypothetical protein
MLFGLRKSRANPGIAAVWIEKCVLAQGNLIDLSFRRRHVVPLNPTNCVKQLTVCQTFVASTPTAEMEKRLNKPRSLVRIESMLVERISGHAAISSGTTRLCSDLA